ncbi:Na/Pi cotransporter family protein [bacterium]|nr:Na/Pi cotransporter family protein [bacterium]
MIRGLLELVGGLGLLLYGLRTASESLQVLFGERLRRRVAAVGGGRRAQFEIGVVAGLVTQSSAAAAVRIVSFVNAGLMTLAQAASVLVGANLGATVSALVLALPAGPIALGLLGLGAALHLFASRESARFAGALAMAAGMLFVAIGWLADGWRALGPQALPLWILQPDVAGPTAYLAAALAAALATAALQSAIAAIGVGIALATAGDLSLAGAATLVIGANVGSCVTVLRAAAPANADGRRAAVLDILLNASTGIALLVLIGPWVHLLAMLPSTAPDGIARPLHLAATHAVFNLLLAVLSLPLLAPLRLLAERLVVSSYRDRPALRYLRQSVVEAPALAIEQARLQVLNMAALTIDALQLTRMLYAEVHTPQAELRRQILEREKATDAIQHEVTVFLARVLTGTLSSAQSDECRALIRAADEIESVADYCERLANYRRRLIREGTAFDDGSLRDLQSYLERTGALFEDVVDRIRRNEVAWLEAVATKGQYLATEADTLREANLHRLTAQRIDPTAGIFFNDMLVAMRRIRNHSLNLAEAMLGQK